MKIAQKTKEILSGISPRFTTKLMYLYNFKKPLNLRNPQTINEKLQYLKLYTYYDNPVITQCVDKYLVREWLEKKGHAELLPRFYGVYTGAEQLRADWDKFPARFVIKCNHGCGFNILVSNKDKQDLDAAIKTLDGWMKQDFWKIYCEPQYRFVKKRIIVEEYLADDIKTYKFYCFNGTPKVAYISTNGENGEKDLYLDYYDMDWNWLPITLYPHLHSKEKTEKPLNFEKMVELSKELSRDFPFVRVDLYNVEGKIYFSELTFIPTGGNMKLEPATLIDEWGTWLEI